MKKKHTNNTNNYLFNIFKIQNTYSYLKQIKNNILFFKDMLEDLMNLILGRQLNLFICLDTQNGVNIGMVLMKIRLIGWKFIKTKQIIRYFQIAYTLKI